MRINIVNGKIISHNTLTSADLVIEDGVISEIRNPGAASVKGTVLDATGLLVLPGAIDIHFHCRAPAYPERGDFATETRAAAAGGVTTVFEMPISKPGASTVEVFERRRALGEREAYVNFGLYAAPALLDEGQIAGMVDAGAIGFKTFLTAAPEGRADEFEGLCAVTDETIYQVLRLLKPYDLPAVFHSENNRLLDWFDQQSGNVPLRTLEDHARARPAVVESAAIAMLIALVMETGRGVHVAHLSSADGVAFIADAQRRGLPVTTEVCPHYLIFAAEEINEAGPYGKVNPPIRTRRHRQALWQGLREGVISIIASDHSPFAMSEKEETWHDLRVSPPGIANIDVFYPLVLDMALRGRFSLAEAVQLVSARPASMYGLFPQKGVIQVGADGDLVLFDPRGTTIVDHRRWQSNAADCDRLFSGMELRGRLKQTIVGGKVVYRDGDIVGSRGGGQFVRPLNGTTTGALAEDNLDRSLQEEFQEQQEI